MNANVNAKEFIGIMKSLGSSERAVNAGRYFKTGKGQYGEGDIFVGVANGEIHAVAKEFLEMPLHEIEKLLESPIHEVRFGGLSIMNILASKKKTSDEVKEALYNLYLKRTDRINNWDLVDCSCREVVGGYLLHKSREVLYRLAQSENLWERRIAMVSTWQFIRNNDLEDTFTIAVMLLNDKHDLIHKAVGWMLREAGQKDIKKLLNFLDNYVSKMPRTALSYAIEKLDEGTRKHYLSIKKEP